MRRLPVRAGMVSDGFPPRSMPPIASPTGPLLWSQARMRTDPGLPGPAGARRSLSTLPARRLAAALPPPVLPARYELNRRRLLPPAPVRWPGLPVTEEGRVSHGIWGGGKNGEEIFWFCGFGHPSPTPPHKGEGLEPARPFRKNMSNPRTLRLSWTEEGAAGLAPPPCGEGSEFFPAFCAYRACPPLSLRRSMLTKSGARGPGLG
jgi:hypothetical protein